MKVLLLICAVLSLLLPSITAAWEPIYLQVEVDTRESSWRDALATHLEGEQEIAIEAGRIDVLTDQWAIEVDWINKWHEGLGQSLHYADATSRQGVLALISYSRTPSALQKASRRRLDIVQRQCTLNGIHLLVLFRGTPDEERDLQQRIAQNTEPLPDFWLNTKSGTLHRPECRYFQSTSEGRSATRGEGTPCRLCHPSG